MMAGKKPKTKSTKQSTKETTKGKKQQAPQQETATPPAAAPSRPVVIDSSIKNDRSVEIRGDVSLNASTVAQVQRGLLQQDIAKEEHDASSLKLYIGPTESNKHRLQDQAALADTMLLVSRPVDTIITSGTGPDVLKAFLSATGKCYMFAGASLHLGVQKGQAPYGKNKTNQVRRKLFNDYKTDLQTLVMMKSGETDRRKVYKDLLSAKPYNAMEALFYGKKGLIDGILIHHDQVITREDMDRYFRARRWKKPQIEEFIKHYINVYKLPTRKLRDFAPDSVPEGTFSYYQSLKKPSTEEKKKQEKEEEKKPEAERKPQFYVGEKKLDYLLPRIRATTDKPPKRIMIDYAHPRNNSILHDDVIFFNSGFRDETAEQIVDYLLSLEHKKIATDDKSHIKILQNSPGGSVWSGQELRSTIKSLKTKVDVIVYGMGASCGSWLLCSATGNRFATPNSRIMFHEAASQVDRLTPHDHFNELHDSLDQATLDYISIVSEAVDRDFEQVLRDFDNDVWLNPVEALFYGNKGLIDAILVDHDCYIDREAVEKYMIKKLGSKKHLNTLIERVIQEKRDPRQGMEWRPEWHNEDDPFENPLKTIEAVMTQSAKKLADSPRFRGSAPQPSDAKTIDYFNVVFDD